MPDPRPTLHLICGKIAAGKSTLAARLAAAPRTVLISEDHWLARLYPSEISTLQDYVRCTGRLRATIGPHIEHVLRASVSIVLDFPANTTESRSWIRGLIENSGAAHQLHFLDASDELCKARLRDRNSAGTHEFAPSDADFDLISSFFVPPSEAEGFNVIRYEVK